MKSKRIKVQIPTIANRDEAEAVMNALACTINNQRQIAAVRDAEILAINKRYEKTLSFCADAIQVKTESLRAWAETNPDAFPKGRKSIEFVSGILGFRTGTPKLALVSRAWTWEKVLEKVKTILPNFIRNDPAVDKEAILGQRDELAEFLPMVGLKVTQDESFFIEPKLADMDARQVASPARTSEAA